jgi:hypothetical protein
MGNLSESEIQRIIKADERFESRGDGGGLYLSYRKVSATPTWQFRFRQHGEQHKLSIGCYPRMSLDEARLLAASYRKLIESDESVIAAVGNKRLAHSDKELARTFSAMIREASRHGAKRMTVTIELELASEIRTGR